MACHTAKGHGACENACSRTKGRDVDVVTVRQPPPPLHQPVLVAAFRGWNDAGEAASGALEVLWRELKTRSFAEVDPEEFFDFQLTRPTIRFDRTGNRVVDWPRNRLGWAALPRSERHVVLLDGTEPHLRWRTFAGGVVALAQRLGVVRVITLGALQVDAPHTRAVPVNGSASSPELAERLGLRRSSYEGPTGITGVLHQACTAEGLESVSLWAGIPHYLAGAAYFAGALAVAERAAALLEIEITLTQLARDAAAQRDDIAELVREDEDLAEYVAELETHASGAPGVELSEPHVSGDELAAEFERYLRDRRIEG